MADPDREKDSVDDPNADPSGPAEPEARPDADAGELEIDQDEIDALISRLQGRSAPPPPPPASEAPPEPESGTADDEPADDPISSENAAASDLDAGPLDDLLSQNLIDTIIQEAAAERAGATSPAPPPSLDDAGIPTIEQVDQAAKDLGLDFDHDFEEPPQPARAAPKAPKPPRPAPAPPAGEGGPPPKSRPAIAWGELLGRVVGRLRPAKPLKLAVSVAAGLLAGIAMYAILDANRQQVVQDLPGGTEQTPGGTGPLDDAERLAQLGRYNEAGRAIEAFLDGSPSGTALGDALFLRAELAYRGLPDDPPLTAMDEVHAAIDTAVDKAPLHPRVPEALRWKAALYEKEGLYYPALRFYTRVIAEYGNVPFLDEVLYEAAGVELALDHPDRALALLEELLDRFPGSRLAAPALFRVAEAHRKSGNLDRAVQMLRDMAQAHHHDRLGAQAYAELGRMMLAEGNAEEAVRLLEARRNQATTTEGNEPVYLMLAEAYEQQGQPIKAAELLRELIEFFPESGHVAEAYVRLSRLLRQMGQDDEALRVASSGALRYPENAEVRRHEATLLAAVGRYTDAAEALLEAADKASEPSASDLRLEAAHYLRDADEANRAVSEYARVIERNPSGPRSTEARVAHAETLFTLGRMSDAVDRLEALLLETQGTPGHTSVLAALTRAYSALGLGGRAADLASQLARYTADPQQLALCAETLLDAGRTDDGLAAARQVRADALPPDAAYAFLARYGSALLRANPDKGLAVLEQAHADYPSHRTPEGEQALIGAFLAKSDTAAVRQVLTGLETLAREDPAQAGRLVSAATQLGDYYFDRGDYRAAASAYGQAAQAGFVPNQDAWYAQYQRANALLATGDFDAAIPILDEVAASPAPWAAEAAVKGRYARIEQRVRGLPVTPEPVAEAAAS